MTWDFLLHNILGSLAHPFGFILTGRDVENSAFTRWQCWNSLDFGLTGDNRFFRDDVVRGLLLTFCTFWNLPVYFMYSFFSRYQYIWCRNIWFFWCLWRQSYMREIRFQVNRSEWRRQDTCGSGWNSEITKSLPDSIREESDWLDCSEFESNGAGMLSRGRSELWNVWVNSCSEEDIILVVLFVDFYSYL